MSGSRSRRARSALARSGDAKAVRVLDRAIKETALGSPAYCARCDGPPTPVGLGPTILEADVQPEPLPTLQRMVELRGLIGSVEALCVRQARDDGESWAAIGAALGVTGQATAKRFGGA